MVRLTTKRDPRIIVGVAQECLAPSWQLPLSIRILSINNKTVSALGHWLISLIDILPVGQILTSACLHTAISIFMRSTIAPQHLNPFEFTLLPLVLEKLGWFFPRSSSPCFFAYCNFVVVQKDNVYPCEI